MNNSKITTLIMVAAIAVIAFVAMPQTAKAIAPNAGDYGLTCTCVPCTCWFRQCVCFRKGDLTVYGHASGTVTTLDDLSIPDFSSLSTLKRSNVYIGDGNNPGNGTRYINVPITSDTLTGDVVLLIEAEGVVVVPTTEDNWDEIIRCLEDAKNYADEKVLVYPNPTSNTSFVKLYEDYVSTYNVQSVSVQIYKGATLVATLNSSDPNSIILIDESIIPTGDTYYANCSIVYIDGTSTEQVDVVNVPFVVIK
ncbi:MAG: hypothetical protein LBO69_02540 [Ignavibacteria bacterium]|jgi:hypothetical protein|nr:hypothetical protein [Ignavibacteria bacterium]